MIRRSGAAPEEQAAGPRLRWARGTSFHLFNADAAGDYASELDCRLLFLGGNYGRAIRAYREVVRYMRAVSDPAELADALRSSTVVHDCYDVLHSNGQVSVTLRDAVFCEPGPRQDLTPVLRLKRRRRSWQASVALERLAALGALFPLVRGNHDEEEIRSRLDAQLPAAEAAWALELLSELRRQGFVDRAPSIHLARSRRSIPRVTLLSHSSVLFESRRSALVVDPLRDLSRPLARSLRDAAAMKLGAIVCSHSHWDHCNLDTLLLFDKRTPVIVPRVERPTAFNPPMLEPLRMLGFTDIREARLWEPIAIDDIEFVPVPFYGEQDEPGAEIDHMTYLLKTDGLVVYGGVDCFMDADQTMDGVFARVRDAYGPDIAFLPISKMVYSYKDGGVNGFCRYLDQARLNESFQYTAGPADAAEWVRILDPKVVAPYATFVFSRMATPEAVAEFERELRARHVDKRLHPLLPGTALDPSDLNGRLTAEARRQATVALYRARPERLMTSPRKLRAAARGAARRFRDRATSAARSA